MGYHFGIDDTVIHNIDSRNRRLIRQSVRKSLFDVLNHEETRRLRELEEATETQDEWNEFISIAIEIEKEEFRLQKSSPSTTYIIEKLHVHQIEETMLRQKEGEVIELRSGPPSTSRRVPKLPESPSSVLMSLTTFPISISTGSQNSIADDTSFSDPPPTQDLSRSFEPQNNHYVFDGMEQIVNNNSNNNIAAGAVLEGHQIKVSTRCKMCCGGGFKLLRSLRKRLRHQKK